MSRNTTHILSEFPSQNVTRKLSTKQDERIYLLFKEIENRSVSHDEAYHTLLRVFEYVPKDDLAQIEKDFTNENAEWIFKRLQTLLQENSMTKFGNSFKEKFAYLFKSCFNIFEGQFTKRYVFRETHEARNSLFTSLLHQFIDVVVVSKDIRWILKIFEKNMLVSDLPYGITEEQVEKATNTSRDNYYYIKRLQEDSVKCSNLSALEHEINKHLKTDILVDPIRYISYDNKLGSAFFLSLSNSWYDAVRSFYHSDSQRFMKIVVNSEITPRSMIVAARLGIPEVFEYALKSGNYNYRDNPANHIDELRAALEAGHLEIAKLIIRHEPDTIIFDKNDIIVADQNGYHELADFMKDHNLSLY